MKDKTFLSVWIKRFLLEHLISVMNVSKNTQKSYRDTFRLLLQFIANLNKKFIENLIITDLNVDIIKLFLSSLEKKRHCSVSTRNQRLSAIHTFAKFIAANEPACLEWCRQIQIIPLKKTKKSLVTYLDKSEMDALLNAPDKRTHLGYRDYVLILFLYNTGARADEAAQLTIADLSIAHAKKRDLSIVLIRGKGNKLRRCPLWQNTVDGLQSLIKNRNESEHVFINRCNQPLTRFGINSLVKRYAKASATLVPSMQKKQVSPHTIRHTTATHLLLAGVDINTIRAWLGHVSVNTTNVYAEVNLEMKAKALACCEINGKKSKGHWRDDKDLMQFLEAI